MARRGEKRRRLTLRPPAPAQDDYELSLAKKPYIAYDASADRTPQNELRPLRVISDDQLEATRNTSRGAWRTIPFALGQAIEGSYSVADGCTALSCTPSWMSFTPQPKLDAAGVYEVHVHVPSFDPLAEACEARATSAPVVVRDATRGYVLVNVSMATPGWKSIGNFTFTAGPGKARHAAVVIDSLGATGPTGEGGTKGCVAADAVRWTRVNESMTGGCADPRAANYDPAAARRDAAGAAVDMADGDVDGYSACLYVGSRGLTRQAWSMMAPEYRHSGWARNLDSRLAFGTGASCTAPPLNSTDWYTCKDGYCGWHEPCVAASASGQLSGNVAADAKALGVHGSYCCLTNDHWGCDPTWDAGYMVEGDEDNGPWVTVFKQDTDEYMFSPDEWRKNAHGGAALQDTFSILDDLEGMRRLSDGMLELKLTYPGGYFYETHWTQDKNPVMMWIEEVCLCCRISFRI